MAARFQIVERRGTRNEEDRTGNRRCFYVVAGNASAADMAPPLRQGSPAPIAPIYNWTGFYIGAAVGGSWIDGDAYTSFNQGGGAFPIGAFNQTRRLDSSSFIGGVYAGYYWQAANWVLGVEADISGLIDSDATATAPNLAFPGGALLAGGFVFNRSQEWLSTVRGRLGFLAAPNVLLYGTAGARSASRTTSPPIPKLVVASGPATSAKPRLAGPQVLASNGWPPRTGSCAPNTCM